MVSQIVKASPVILEYWKAGITSNYEKTSGELEYLLIQWVVDFNLTEPLKKRCW
jgi:hypothetical protein